MKQIVKCQNCSANLETDSENHLKFCPYCGTEIQIDETAFDHEKFVLKHEEEVRQQKVKEKAEEDRKALIYIGLTLLFCAGLLYIFGFLK